MKYTGLNRRLSGSTVFLAVALVLMCTAGITASLRSDSSLYQICLISDLSCSDVPHLPLIQAPTPADISYAAGEPGHNITWTVDGYYASWTYQILFNGSPSISGSSSSIVRNVTISVDCLQPDVYNFTIRATNIDGTATDPVIVNVLPSVAPILTSPEDLSSPSVQVGNQISWIPTDATTGMRTYTLYRNGTSVGSGWWTSGEVITFSLSGLSPGTYNFTIVVDDGIGGVARDEVLVLLYDLAPMVNEVVWGVVIAFACAGVLVVFKAVKVVPMVHGNRKDVKL